MKYKEYDLEKVNDFNKFRSIERTKNTGREVKGYIYAILNQDKLRLGTLSVKSQPPYEYFTVNHYLAPSERHCIVVLSEPHIKYKSNLQLITALDTYVDIKLDDDLQGFEELLSKVAIDGSIETEEIPKQEKTAVQDLHYSSMSKGDLYIFLSQQLEKIEKLNSIINEKKKERDEIHTAIKSAEMRLKQIL